MFIVMPVLLRDRLSTFSTQYRQLGCFPGMMSLLAKTKQIIVHTFRHFFYNYLIFDVP